MSNKNITYIPTKELRIIKNAWKWRSDIMYDFVIVHPRLGVTDISITQGVTMGTITTRLFSAKLLAGNNKLFQHYSPITLINLIVSSSIAITNKYLESWRLRQGAYLATINGLNTAGLWVHGLIICALLSVWYLINWLFV